MMRFRKYALILLMPILLFLTVLPIHAWFGYKITSTGSPSMSGATGPAYFAGGDGSVDSPYIITEATHLYNLAWLQYIGYFNLNPNASNGRAQSYFILADNIDMLGYDALPPIGTTQYPFHGNFDGNGKVISNLKVANMNGDEAIKQFPETAEFENINSKNMLEEYLGTTNEAGQIIGFFGVIGDYNGSIAAAVGSKAGCSSSDATPPTTEDDATSSTNASILYTQAITAKNFSLDKLLVVTDSQETTIGLAAGYVNAKIEGIAISESSLKANSATAGYSNTSNISDFFLVGYCTNGNFVNETSVTIYNPTTTNREQVSGGEGDGTESNWGASIAIKDLYNNIDDIENLSGGYSNYAHSASKASGATNTNAYYVVDRVLSTTGMVRHDIGTQEYFSLVYTYTIDPTGKHLGGGSKISHYEFSKNDNSVNVNTIKFGDKFLNMSISSNGLPSLTLGTDSTTATKWGFSDGSTGYLFAITDDYKIYLNVVDGKITFSSSGSTTWGFTTGSTNTDTGLYYTLNGTNNYLKYTGTDWVFDSIDSTGAAYFLVHKGDNYLSLGSTKTSHPDTSILVESTDLANATRWYIVENVENGTYDFYTRKNGQKHVLFIRTLGVMNDYTLYWQGLINEEFRSDWVKETYDGKDIYYFAGNYLTVDSSGNWTYSNSVDTSITFTSYSYSYNLGVWTCTENGSMTDISYSAVTGAAQTLEFQVGNENDATYLPLQMDSSFGPTNLNTGYITSGFYDELFNRAAASDINADGSDIRVAQYYTYNINEEDKVLTWNNSTNQFVQLSTNEAEATTIVNELGLKKYLSVVEGDKTTNGSVVAYNAIRGDVNQELYGFHFMDASININSLITIPTANINGNIYNNYQVPGDCIDFHLKSKGYINFFAGSYFPGTNCFFSLHHIERDSNQNIISIKEISKVYGKTNSSLYIYQYSDGTYSTTLPSDFSSYTELFDTVCLTNPGQLNSQAADTTKVNVRGDAYYFEIPVNAGEYALGSVEGKTGAYLLYLDIGSGLVAGVGKAYQTVTYEAFSETGHSYANGVGVSEDSTYPTNEHVALSLSGNYNGSMSITKSDSKITIGGTNTTSILKAELGVDVLDKEISSVITRRVTVKYENETNELIQTVVITKIGDASPTIVSGVGTLSSDGTTLTVMINDRETNYEIDWDFISVEDSNKLVGYSVNYSASFYHQLEYVNNTTYNVRIMSSDTDTNISKSENMIFTADSGTLENSSASSDYYTITKE